MRGCCAIPAADFGASEGRAGSGAPRKRPPSAPRPRAGPGKSRNPADCQTPHQANCTRILPPILPHVPHRVFHARRTRARRGARTRADGTHPTSLPLPGGSRRPCPRHPDPGSFRLWGADSEGAGISHRTSAGHPYAVFLELVGKRAEQALAGSRCRATPRPLKRRCVHAVRSRNTGAARSCLLAGPPLTPRPGASGAQSTPPRLWRPPRPTTCRTGPDLSARAGARRGALY